jgi:triosephosphate isomerase
VADKLFWIGTSWKMNKTLAEAMAFAEGLVAGRPERFERIQPFVIPPFTAVREVKKALAATHVRVGAQNMHWEDAGAWTGEISPVMLRDCGLDIVELGHSERREHFGETNETVGRKVAAALRHGLTPLVCVGETLEERESGRADSVLAEEVEGALAFLDEAAKAATILFAYEPVWAIGEGGIPASPDYAAERQARIAAVAGRLLPAAPPVLYGGSVNARNCEDLIRRPAIDGLFIGRAAWDVEGYLDILGKCSAAIGGKA